MIDHENILVIGIAGGTGSGKTTLARHIADAFGDRVTVITHDSYYRLQEGKTYEERCLQNYDHPDAFETELLCEHLRRLCRGQAVDVPVYDYTIHNRSERTTRAEPRAVIILEGILLFSDPALRDLMDLRIFVDTDADERILRRIAEDVLDLGVGAAGGVDLDSGAGFSQRRDERLEIGLVADAYEHVFDRYAIVGFGYDV
jgi:uridine kinase